MDDISFLIPFLLMSVAASFFVILWFGVLRMKSAFLKIVTRFCPIPIFVKDENLNLIYSTDAYFHLISQSQQDFNEEGVENTVLETGLPASYRHAFEQNNETRKVDIAINKVRTGQGDGVVGIIIDVTDLEGIKDSLGTLRSQYKRLVESVVDMSLVLDHNLVVQLCTPQISEHLGYSPEEVVGFSMATYMSEEEFTTFSTSLNTENVFFTVQMIHKDGGPKWFEFSSSRSDTGDWRIVGRDVSQKVVYEQALMDQNRILQESTSILTSIAQASATDIGDLINEKLCALGGIADVSLLQVYENMGSEGIKKTYEWCAEKGLEKTSVRGDLCYREPVASLIQSPEPFVLPFRMDCLNGYHCQDRCQNLHTECSTTYLIGCPIHIRRTLWGVMCYYTAHSDKVWLDVQKHSLGFLSIGIGSVVSLQEELSRNRTISSRALKTLEILADGYKQIGSVNAKQS